MTPPTTVAVVGLGTMGRGIANTLSAAGNMVIAFDDLQANPTGIDPSVRVAGDLSDCIRDADLIVEAIFEDLEAKRRLIALIQGQVGPVPIASNTSTFQPSALAEGAAHPEAVLVAHWVNPAQTVPLVELVGGRDTPPAVVHQVRTLLSEAGKVVVTLEREAPGFVLNRLQSALIREAIHIVTEGIASPAQVDEVMTAGLGPRWSVAGPFETMDRGGLDVWQKVTEQLFPVLSTHTRTPDLITSLVTAGNLGTKSGEGFFTYVSESGAAFEGSLKAVLEARSTTEPSATVHEG